LGLELLYGLRRVKKKIIFIAPNIILGYYTGLVGVKINSGANIVIITASVMCDWKLAICTDAVKTENGEGRTMKNSKICFDDSVDNIPT